MKTGIKVSDIMTRKLVTVSPETSVKECVEKVFKEKSGMLLVTNNSELLGIVTKRDILGVMIDGRNPQEVKASEVMTTGVKTTSPTLDIYDAIIKMSKVRIKKLPVIHENKVVGVLTLVDILKIEPQLFDYMTDAIYIREQAEKLKRREERLAVKSDSREDRVEGPCESCGNFDYLDLSESSRLLCAECRDAKRS